MTPHDAAPGSPPALHAPHLARRPPRAPRLLAQQTPHASPGAPRAATDLRPPPTPRLRGVLHAVAAGFAVVGAAALVAGAHSTRGRIAAAVYGASLFALFFVSALYHRTAWTRRGRRIARALDHATIFVFIAASYTPLCLLVEPRGHAMLALGWACAALGVAKAVFWPRAPKKLGVAMYIGVGLLAVPLFPRLLLALGPGRVLLLGLGGVAYIAGAIVYARRRPNPLPRLFGYHEVFHALTVVAAGGHFVVASSVIAALP